LIRVSIEKKDVLLRRPERRAVLAATRNSLFGLRYVPTSLFQYFRPDAIGFRGTFPWVTFSHFPHVFGGVVFDNIEPTASVTVTSVLLVSLAVVGVVATVKRVRAPGSPDPSRKMSSSSTAVYRTPLLAAAITTASTVTIAVVFERYEGDYVPLLVVGAAVGLFWLSTLLSGKARRLRLLVGTVLVAMAAWSCCATLSLTLIYQREY